MNVVELNTPRVPEALREKLAQLPEFAPPQDLWMRIARQRTARRRRPWALGGGALAAGLALALWFGGGMAPSDDPALPEFVAQSRALESELRAARGAAANPELVAMEGELARVDAALQSAYDRGAPPGELAQLWQQRAGVLRTLVAAYRHPDTLVRI